jgi:hypothetical protein
MNEAVLTLGELAEDAAADEAAESAAIDALFAYGDAHCMEHEDCCDCVELGRACRDAGR